MAQPKTADQIVEELITSVKERKTRILGMEVPRPDVTSITPYKVVETLLGLESALEAVSDLLGEIPIFLHQVNQAQEHLSSVVYSNAVSYLKAVQEQLEGKKKLRANQIMVMRGILSKLDPGPSGKFPTKEALNG